MFSLHESTRITLCRIAFFALCVVPTAAVLAWCGFVNSPTYTRVHERAIETRLKWRAKLTKASTPRPDLVLYEGLDLSDPETGQLLARLPSVEWQTDSDGVTVRIPQPATVNGERLEAFWNLALAETRQDRDPQRLRLECGSLSLHLALGNQSFIDVSGQIEHGERSELSLHFCRATAGEAAAEPSGLTIVRDRTATPATTSVQFTTGESGLPCDLLAGVCPAIKRLGRASSFRGRVQAEQTDNWQGELAGSFRQVDLDLLVAGLPHKLSGTAQIDIERAAFAAGRIESLIGMLSAGPGTVSRSLIHAAHSTLSLEASKQAMTGAENRLAYESLNLAFEIGPQGLTLRGVTPKQTGAVLVDKSQVLLREPSIGPQPVLNLVRALVPQSAVQVPATRETDGLTGLLPIPSIVVPPGQEVPLPAARPLRVNTRRQ
jgi:hypothetical protein